MEKINTLFSSDFIKSYQFYSPMLMKTTMFQFNENSNSWAYLDNVLIAQLIHASGSKRILDFGCYLGIMPLLVEDILRTSNSNAADDLKWTLVDNFMFTKAAKNDLAFPTRISKFWNEFVEMFPWAEGLPIPPVNEVELLEFLTAINNQFGAPTVGLKIFSSIQTQTEQFDLISFDLSADNFDDNIIAFKEAIALLKDGGLIVMDDVKPLHPSQLAIFVYAITNNLDLHPFAFGRNKVVLLKSNIESKQSRIDNILENLHIGYNPDLFFWTLYNNPIFGKCIKLRIHK